MRLRDEPSTTTPGGPAIMDIAPITYAQAVALVVEDQRSSEDAEDGATDADIIAHVRNTVTLPGVHAVGGWPIEDMEDALTAAYVLVVATTDATATVKPFDPRETVMNGREARGHYLHTGHTLTGYYVTVGGLSTLIRTCEH